MPFVLYNSDKILTFLNAYTPHPFSMTEWTLIYFFLNKNRKLFKQTLCHNLPCKHFVSTLNFLSNFRQNLFY